MNYSILYKFNDNHRLSQAIISYRLNGISIRFFICIKILSIVCLYWMKRFLHSIFWCRKNIILLHRRNGRAVECGGLENRCPPNGGPGVRIPLPPQKKY